MLMRRNVAAGIGSNEQGEYRRAALQRADRKEPRYKWPTLLYFKSPDLNPLDYHVGVIPGRYMRQNQPILSS